MMISRAVNEIVLEVREAEAGAQPADETLTKIADLLRKAGVL